MTRITRRGMFAAGCLVSLFAGEAIARTADDWPRTHHLIIQVTADDPTAMRLALDNAVNVDRHYSEIGEDVDIEIIAYGAGLHMLRDDTSPVKARIKSVGDSLRSVRFVACGNTLQTMERKEGHPVTLVPRTEVVQTGVAYIMDLQEKGWSYVRP